jgi:7-keto-8-aminopelargonate synthetase-like enzyme
MEALENLLIKSEKKSEKLIITDGVFSMDGDIAPLTKLAELAEKYGAFIMVDDAHGTGVFGEKGTGLAEYFGVSKKINIHMGTFSKAVGSFGGFIACSKDLKDYLINKSRNFIYTTSLPPSVIAASIEGLNLIETQPERREELLKKAFRIRTCLNDEGLDTMGSQSQIIPVYIGDDSLAMRVSGLLMEEKIFIPAIRPPTVPYGKARLRISVAADHSESEIDKLIKALISTFKYLNII